MRKKHQPGCPCCDESVCPTGGADQYILTPHGHGSCEGGIGSPSCGAVFNDRQFMIDFIGTRDELQWSAYAPLDCRPEPAFDGACNWGGPLLTEPICTNGIDDGQFQFGMFIKRGGGLYTLVVRRIIFFPANQVSWWTGQFASLPTSGTLTTCGGDPLFPVCPTAGTTIDFQAA